LSCFLSEGSVSLVRKVHDGSAMKLQKRSASNYSRVQQFIFATVIYDRNPICRNALLVTCGSLCVEMNSFSLVIQSSERPSFLIYKIIHASKAARMKLEIPSISVLCVCQFCESGFFVGACYSD